MSGVGSFLSAVVVGGSGAVGSLLANVLARTGTRDMFNVDRHPPPAPDCIGTFVDGDIVRPSPAILERLRSCDLLVLATPEPVAIEALAAVLPEMRSGSLIVDTLSVKSRFAVALTQSSAAAEILGINPMFAPSLGFKGRSVIAVPYRAGPRTEAFLAVVAAQGADIVRLDAEHHDEACAALQVVTHASILAFGMALAASGHDLSATERIMPPPHRMLLALLARIASADPEVYRDIQCANPYAARARAQLVDAHRRLERIVASDDPEPFRRLIEETRALLGGSETDYADLCARMFEGFAPK